MYESPNEAEFFAYAMLWQIHQIFPLNKLLALIPKDILKSPQIKTALKIIDAYHNKNYRRVLLLVKKLPYLFACASFHAIVESRKLLIRELVKANSYAKVS